MKLIIAGGRDFNDYNRLEQEITILYPIEGWQIEIVHGGATGADTLASKFAHTHTLEEKKFLPDYDKWKSTAPLYRNTDMANYGDVLIAFWNGKSRGTKDMINKALARNCEVHVYRY